MSEIAVIGAGTMGHALALVFALGGHRVRLTDSNAGDAAPRAGALMATALETLAEAGEVDAAGQQTGLGQAVRCATRWRRRVRGADLVSRRSSRSPRPSARCSTRLEALMQPGRDPRQQHQPARHVPAGAGGAAAAHADQRIGTRHPTWSTWSTWSAGRTTDPAVVETVRNDAGGAGQGADRVPEIRARATSPTASRRRSRLEVYSLLDAGMATPEEVDLSVIHGLALRLPVLGVMAKADFTGLPLVQHGADQRQLLSRRSRAAQHRRWTSWSPKAAPA